MWAVYVIFLGLEMALLIGTSKEAVEEGWKPDRMYRIFLKPASRLERWLEKREKSMKRGNAAEIRLREDMRILYPSNAADMIRRHRAERISALLFLGFLGAIFGLLVTMAGQMQRRVTKEGWVWRNSYGQGTARIELQVEGEEEDRRLQVEVEERKYTRKQLEEMRQELRAVLEEELKGENESLDEVRSALFLPSWEEGFPFRITWESGDYGRIKNDGSVTNADVGKEGEVIWMKATLTYFEDKWEERFPVRVCPPVLTEDEIMQNRILEEIRKRDEESAYDEGFSLPDREGDEPLQWVEHRSDNSLILFAVFLMAGLAQYGLPDRDLRKRMEERREQLLRSYPEFISKLVLLMGAGLPVRAAFFRMASDYRKKRISDETGYVYEELILTCREMESGVTEIQAYEHFGERCHLPQYRKCMTLLTQNLKKGSAGLIASLQEEATRSLSERMRHAREEGERAGTKLLLPMIMMLTVVMVLIMVPACFSFTGM